MNTLLKAAALGALVLLVLGVNAGLRLVGTADLLSAGVIVVGLVLAARRIRAAGTANSEVETA